jgi:hypothetical protein
MTLGPRDADGNDSEPGPGGPGPGGCGRGHANAGRRARPAGRSLTLAAHAPRAGQLQPDLAGGLKVPSVVPCPASLGIPGPMPGEPDVALDDHALECERALALRAPEQAPGQLRAFGGSHWATVAASRSAES